MTENENINKNLRVRSIDLLRGVVMVIMALDHTRDFFHVGALTGDPLNPTTTTFLLFFTRWITHLCAPTFVFLSGLSAWLQGVRKTKKELAVFLIIRGCWLIFIDLTVMTLLITADVNFKYFILETLWAIGVGMILLGVVLQLPYYLILSLGIVIVFGHNILDLFEKSGNLSFWWHMMHAPGLIPLPDGHGLFIFYPFLPWAGLLLLGYCCGNFYTGVAQVKRKRILIFLGAGCIIFFLLLRYANLYGNPSLWKEQQNSLATFFSFMNVEKYPPSLMFICATIGPGLLFLAYTEDVNNWLCCKLSVFGRVPFFYFIVHFFILHVGQIIFYLSNGHGLLEGMKGLESNPIKFSSPGEGVSLGVVYLIWASIVIIMYPLSRWYDNYKQSHKSKRWLRFL